MRDKLKQKEYNKKYYIKNKEKILNKVNIYQNKNRESRTLYEKSWKNNNIDKVKSYRHSWNLKNTSYWSEYERHKIISDPIFKIKKLLRKRFRNALKNNSKTSSILDILGCNIEELKNNLQQTAINNGYIAFDINNYSTKDYHIDHIVPCDAFNLECSYHQKLCFNYNNLQILSSKENLLKGNSYD